MVMEVVQEDMGEGNVQCTNHPFKNSNPGGICAFCLQEKLGKLVSSSFPVAVFPSSSSPSSPSFRSDYGGGNGGNGGNAAPSLQLCVSSSSSSINRSSSTNGDYRCGDQNRLRRSRVPFLMTHRNKKKKKKDLIMAESNQASIVFKRSKSTAATPRRGVRFMEAEYAGDYNSGQKRGFWSFLYLSKHRKTEKNCRDLSCTSSSATSSSAGTSATIGSLSQQRPREKKKKEEFAAVEENASPDGASFDRKVSRSRSVGCGSRSFSGDFFERISTGFGDCTLRRVESQREGKPKVNNRAASGAGTQDCIKERVKCAGIFSGFMIASSSSSSSSAEDHMNGKGQTAAAFPRDGNLGHGRSRSWAWAFASPMRAFSKPSSGKREAANKNAAPNLAAIPSLLTVGG